MPTEQQYSAAKISLQANVVDLLEKKNVVGAGIGYKVKDGKTTDTLAIICFVESKVSADSLYKTDVLPETLSGTVVDVVEVGIIEALVRKTKNRPAMAGISVGHPDITAGTLGLWVNQGGKTVMLSNNHVIANSNDANIGDEILQPGPYDGGNAETDKIAELADYEPINWTSNDNIMDAAIGSIDNTPPGDPSSDCGIAGIITSILNALASLVNSSTRLQAVRPLNIASSDSVVDNSIYDFDNTPNELVDATIGMNVKKSGRTTGVLEGTITAIDAVVSVNYGDGKVATFVNQIITTGMSDGGDSGSVLVTQDESGLVGLLYAGSSVVTIHNPIRPVFDRFGLSLLA